MRNAYSLLALACSAPLMIANDEQPAEQAPLDIERAPLVVNPEANTGLAAREDCTDTWQQVRDERGLPRLRRAPADPDAPILLRAVVHQIDGCDFLVVGDGDIRPLPLPQEGPLRPQRAQ